MWFGSNLGLLWVWSRAGLGLGLVWLYQGLLWVWSRSTVGLIYVILLCVWWSIAQYSVSGLLCILVHDCVFFREVFSREYEHFMTAILHTTNCKQNAVSFNTCMYWPCIHILLQYINVHWDVLSQRCVFFWIDIVTAVLLNDQCLISFIFFVAFQDYIQNRKLEAELYPKFYNDETSFGIEGKGQASKMVYIKPLLQLVSCSLL